LSRAERDQKASCPPKDRRGRTVGDDLAARRRQAACRAAPQARRRYLPREVFFGRFGFVDGFFSVWASDFERFFPAT
jgi:hypothetical protein